MGSEQRGHVSAAHRTAGSRAGSSTAASSTTSRRDGIYKEARERNAAVGVGPGKPPAPSLPPQRLGKPLSGSSPFLPPECPANPLSSSSAWQTPTTFPPCLPLGRLANPSSVPPSARQPPTGTISSLGPARAPYRLVPLELPPKAPLRGTQRQSCRHQQPRDPRGRTPLPPRSPTTQGACGGPGSDQDESIEALLDKLRLPPLLSPIKDPAPRPPPETTRKPTRPMRPGAPRRT